MSKIITLIRHGSYASGELTEYGKIQVSSIAAKLTMASIIPEAIISSPVVRAEQTARILQQAFKSASSKDLPLKIFRWLHCDEFADIKNFADLDQHAETAGVENIIVVSHEPQIEMLSSSFKEKYTPKHAEALSYKMPSKGTWASLKRDAGSMFSQLLPS